MAASLTWTALSKLLEKNAPKPTTRPFAVEQDRCPLRRHRAPLLVYPGLVAPSAIFEDTGKTCLLDEKILCREPTLDLGQNASFDQSLYMAGVGIYWSQRQE
jgi:hypothetical protein